MFSDFYEVSPPKFNAQNANSKGRVSMHIKSKTALGFFFFVSFQSNGYIFFKSTELNTTRIICYYFLPYIGKNFLTYK
jgi:hypothetical protein